MPAIGQDWLKFHRAYRAMVTAGEMMTDRHYLVGDVIPATFDEFCEKFVANNKDVKKSVLRRDKMSLPCERRPDVTRAPGMENEEEETEKALVVFLGTPKFTTAMLTEQVKLATDNVWKCSTLICVLVAKPTTIVLRAADTVNRTTALRVEFFEEDALAVNITRHELVPKHTPLEEKELQEVLQAYAIQKHQLPRLLTSDPVAAYFGLQRGQVVRIERKSTSAGVYVTYRQVV